MIAFILGVIFLILNTSEVMASGLVGVGTATIPTYLGSAKSENKPIGIFDYQNEFFFVEIQGPEILTQVKWGELFSVGPVISFDFGRDPIKSTRILNAKATELPFSYDLGLAAQLVLPNLNISDEDEFALRFMAQSHSELANANTYRLAARYFFKIFFMLRSEFELEYKYSNENYLSYFYGVSQETAAKTSLREYRSKSGLESFSFSQNIILSFSENYGLLMRWSTLNFTKSSAESPYIKDIGNAKNLFLGASLFYRWN